MFCVFFSDPTLPTSEIVSQFRVGTAKHWHDPNPQRPRLNWIQIHGALLTFFFWGLIRHHFLSKKEDLLLKDSLFFFLQKKRQKNTNIYEAPWFLRFFSPVIFALFCLRGILPGGVVVASKVPPIETQWKQTHGDLLRSTVWIVRRKRWSNPLPRWGWQMGDFFRCAAWQRWSNNWWRKNPLKFQFWQLTQPPWNQRFWCRYNGNPL